MAELFMAKHCRARSGIDEQQLLEDIKRIGVKYFPQL